MFIVGLLIWILTLVSMIIYIYKKYKKNKVERRRRSFKLIEGDTVEKVRN